MKILDARVDWIPNFDNHPSLEVLLEDLPDEKDRVYSRSGSTYFSCLDGMAAYFAYSGPSDGFGGREFKIKMDDGTEKTLKGPWSSRAGSVNNYFGPIVDVAYTDNQKFWNKEKGAYGCYIHGSLTLSNAIIAAKMAKCHLVKVVEDDIMWIPSLAKDVVIKPRIKGRKKPRYERFIYNQTVMYDTLREAKDMTPKKIVGMAIKLADGKIMSSGVMYRYLKEPGMVKGFFGDTGLFYTPVEAACLAFQSGQTKTWLPELTEAEYRKFQ